MKKKILISITITFILSILTFEIIKLNKKEIKEKEININEIIKINETNINIGDTFYIKENNTLEIYDLNKNLLYEYDKKYDYYEIFNDKYIIIKEDNEGVIIDKNGNVIKQGKIYQTEEITTGEKYIFVDNILYNKNLEQIYTLPFNLPDDYYNNLSYCNIINDNLLIMGFKNILINIKTKETILSDFKDLLMLNDMNYLALKQNNKYDIYNTKTNKFELTDVEIDKLNIIKKDNEQIYINKKIYKDNTKINDKYHINSSSCTSGWKLYDSKNNIVIDKCMTHYEELLDNIITAEGSSESLIYINNEIIPIRYYYKSGDYIVTYPNENDGAIIYNNKGIIKEGITNLDYIGNNYYITYKDGTYSLLDKNLNTLKDNINNITCSSNLFCTITDEKENQFLYKGETKLTNNIYTNIIINENKIIGETLFNTYIYTLGNNAEINIDEKQEININNNYNIDYKNEDFFKKYAYIVEQNNLITYKKEVMDLYKLLENNEYLNEYYLLKKLKKLSIVKETNLGDGIGATYTDSETKIRLGENYQMSLYHELTHFIDFSINNNNNRYNLYKCENNYEITKKYKDDCEYIDINTNFITEAGAEVISGKNFTKELEAYAPAPLILEALEYIYGQDELYKWFYESDKYFIKTLLDAGYNLDETKKIIEALTKTTRIPQDRSEIIYITDTLINLYENKNQKDFLEDNVFKYFIYLLTKNKSTENSKYNEKIKSINGINLSSISKEYFIFENESNIIIINNKYYISVLTNKNDMVGYLLIEYNFEQNEIINYEFYERKEM